MSSPPFRIALLGFGTVGAALARRLAGGAAPGLQLTHIFDRRARLKRAALAPDDRLRACAWTASIDDVFTSSADAVVEAIGGVDPACEWIRGALLAGKSVVTSNKQAIAHHGPALLTLASRQGRQLRFEGAVGGAMPIVRAVAGLAGDRLQSITAILNGTTNAVLSRIECDGSSLDEALAVARRHGFAEADPSADLDGTDARAKLSILCALAFGLRVAPDEIAAATCASVTPADFADAARAGETIRQLACASYDPASRWLTAWVGPARVDRQSLFGRTIGPGNAAVITGECAGDVQISGTGAGGDATAVAIISDIVAIARDPAAIVPPPVLARPRHIVGATPSEIARAAHRPVPTHAAPAAAVLVHEEVS